MPWLALRRPFLNSGDRAGAGWSAPALPEDIWRALVDIEIARIHQATSGYPVGALISSLNGLTFRVDETSARAVTRRRR